MFSTLSRIASRVAECRLGADDSGSPRLVSTVLVVAFLACFASCRTPVDNSKAKAAAELAAVEANLAAGRYTEALTVCIDLARTNPLTPGLPELQNRVMAKLTELRGREAALASAQTHSRSAVDVDTRKRIPSSYGLDRFVEGQTNSLRALPNAMEQILRRKISVHLPEPSDLDAFIKEIATSDGINIIKDGAINGAINLHAENVPLVEILDYISRNLGVTFFVGENLIWCTAVAPPETGPPLFTRMYHLRKGISNEEIENNDTVIEQAIKQFVPKSQNSTAAFAFVRKNHVLLVKDTRENLALVEALLDTLDVCPRQILIEARFLAITSDNYRDLGIDWILNSPIGVTTETVLRNGTPVRANQTEIASGASLVNPLTRNTAGSGLNFEYRGVLTDPMFRAVVKALETSGKSRNLAAPRVTTVNNRLAHMEDSLEEHYIKTYNVVWFFTNNIPVLQMEPVPEALKTGILLDVTPSVGADERAIAVRVLPTIRKRISWDEFPFTTANGVSNVLRYPVVAERKIETEVIVQSGETIVLGGLIDSLDTKTTTGAPILSSIPLLGRFFRTDTTEQQQRNLLIFVTATILSDRGENLLPLNVANVALGKDGEVAAPAAQRPPEAPATPPPAAPAPEPPPVAVPAPPPVVPPPPPAMP